MQKIPLRIILEDIRSHHNVGSVFRSADAFAIEHIWLCGITPRPPHRDIHKTALGATESVEWSYHSSSIELMNELEGIWMALEQSVNARVLSEQVIDFEGPLNLVLGNEVKGVSAAIMNAVGEVLEIPQFGQKKSLNVSVSAGIAMHHFRTIWNQLGQP